MKTWVLLLLLFIGSSQIFAGIPPKVVGKAFKQKFPSAINIKWVQESDNLWEVSFKLKDKKVSARYTSDGHWIVTRMEISSAELPEAVRASVKEDYSGCEIKVIKMIISVAVGIYYDIEFKCGDKEAGEIYVSDGHRIRM